VWGGEGLTGASPLAVVRGRPRRECMQPLAATVTGRPHCTEVMAESRCGHPAAAPLKLSVTGVLDACGPGPVFGRTAG
jgi:hypothetical protein